MTDIEKRATDFALKEIHCESVDELERLGSETDKKAFEEIRNDYIRIATEQEAITKKEIFDKACKSFCKRCVHNQVWKKCMYIEKDCPLLGAFRKDLEE